MKAVAKNESPEEECARVFYDGGCPLCRREIGFLRRQSAGAAIEWTDISACADTDLPQGLSRQSALERFHVERGDGKLESGAAAFGLVWRQSPVLRPIGRALRFRPFCAFAEIAYRLFLRLRPGLQGLARWLERRGAGQP